jgi:CheY-like chemotaxis protein
MAPAEPKRVIVADDVRDSADTVAELLAAQGLEARAVYDGREALRVAEEWRPDGAVLDLGLPGLTGYEVARELRGRFGNAIRLVAYTGYTGDSEREQATQAGFDGFLVKPAEPALLLLALGKPMADLVRRSVDARVEQLYRQIELGESLLRHGLARPEALSVICSFLERAFHACHATLPELPISAEERRKLEAQIHKLESLISQARSRH